MKILPDNWRSIRLIPAVENNPRIVRFCATIPGKVCLLVLMALLVYPHSLAWQYFVGGAFLCMVFEKRRDIGLLLGAIMVVAGNPFWFDKDVISLIAQRQGLFDADLLRALRYGGLGLFFAFALGSIIAARKFSEHALLRRPLTGMTFFWLGLLLILCGEIFTGPVQVFLWCFFIAFTGYFWFLALILSAQKKAAGPLTLNVALLQPFWTNYHLPFIRNPAAMQAFLASTGSELAITRIKGIKLLIWGCFVKVLLIWVQEHVVYKYGVNFEILLPRFLNGEPIARYLGWIGLIVSFFEMNASIIIVCALLIGSARMAGFRLLRGTYRALEARSIAEFWNRYSYYFKEMLAELYFYPAFIRYFKNNKAARLVFATFSAAGFGNILFHFMVNIDHVAKHGLGQALVMFQNYVLYAVLLAAGISASQLRSKSFGKRTAAQVITSFLTILAFYCFLHVFDDETGTYGLAQRFAFLFYMFGIDL